MRLLLFPAACLAVCAALAACDLPTDPVPTNPYDPAFAGRRRVTSPDSVALTASTPTSVTISWADRSSFETGFRIERAVVPALGEPVFVPFAAVAADVTSYTDPTLTDTAERLYRVTALALGETDGAPSRALRIRYPTETVDLGALFDLTRDIERGSLTADGETVYAASDTDVWVVDARTGGVRGRLSGAFQVAGLLDGERVAVVQVQSGTSATVRTYAGQTLLGQVTFEPKGTPECTSVVASTVRVSADGQTAAGLCRGASLAVWGAGGGTPLRTVPVPATSFSLDVARNGTRAVVNQGPREVAGYDLVQGVRLWVRTDAGVEPARLSPDATRVLDVATSRPRLLDAATGDVRASSALATGGLALSFSPDGQSVAYGSGTAPDVVVARTADLLTTVRLVQTRVQAFQLTGGGRAVGFRTLPTYSVVRWDFSRGWERAPG